MVSEGRYPRYAGMKVSELLLVAGGFKPSANNQITLAHARRVADSPTTKVVTINFDRSGHCAAVDDVASVGRGHPRLRAGLLGGANATDGDEKRGDAERVRQQSNA